MALQLEMPVVLPYLLSVSLLPYVNAVGFVLKIVKSSGIVFLSQIP